MKASRFERYGSLDGVQVKEVPVPSPERGEVLVRVVAAGLHPGDLFSVKGSPFPVRISTGFLKPKNGVPGYDFSGYVEATGDGVEGYAPGDEVFGAAVGTCAEFVRVPSGTVVGKPPNVSFEEAAAIPTSALAALHGLRDAGKIKAGQRVLINGASGGVGSFAVQIARTLGAEVTAVCGPSSIEMVRSLGADHVIDYSKDDFTRQQVQYDLIMDNVENRSLSECRRALTPEGTLVLNSGTGATGFAFFVKLIKPLLISPFARQNLRRFLSVPNSDDLRLLRDFVESECLRPVLDRCYSLEETSSALKYIESGHAHGKVVVRVAPGQTDA